MDMFAGGISESDAFFMVRTAPLLFLRTCLIPIV
jgi:hypothetical protein